MRAWTQFRPITGSVGKLHDKMIQYGHLWPDSPSAILLQVCQPIQKEIHTNVTNEMINIFFGINIDIYIKNPSEWDFSSWMDIREFFMIHGKWWCIMSDWKFYIEPVLWRSYDLVWLIYVCGATRCMRALKDSVVFCERLWWSIDKKWFQKKKHQRKLF